MTDQSMPAGQESRQPMSRAWLVLLAVSVALLCAAAVFLILNQSDDDDDPNLLLDLGWAHADGEVSAGTINVRLSPAVSGRNRLEIDIDAVEESWLTTVREVDVSFLPYRGVAEPFDVSLELSDSDQQGREDIDLTGSDAWEFLVRTERDGEPERLAVFYVLAPDPNLHGDDAVALLPDDPAAVELYQRASQAVSQWNRVTYEQQLSDGSGLAVVSFRQINDGSDGSIPSFHYFTPGGLEAYVVDTTAYTRYPGEDWEVRQTNAMVPPSEWGGEYEGATGFQLGPISETPSGPCRIVTFVVPGTQRQAVAWYAWCIDEETGTLYRDFMISRAHYMITEFADFNGDVQVVPPEEALSLSDATPAASNQPAADSA